jgi:hypothetical protein
MAQRLTILAVSDRERRVAGNVAHCDVGCRAANTVDRNAVVPSMDHAVLQHHARAAVRIKTIDVVTLVLPKSNRSIFNYPHCDSAPVLVNRHEKRRKESAFPHPSPSNCPDSIVIFVASTSVHSSGWILQFGLARKVRSRRVRPLTNAGWIMSGRSLAAGEPASLAHHQACPCPSMTPAAATDRNDPRA